MLRKGGGGKVIGLAGEGCWNCEDDDMNELFKLLLLAGIVGFIFFIISKVKFLFFGSSVDFSWSSASFFKTFSSNDLSNW